MRRNRGEFSFVTLFFILLFVFTGWLCIKLSQAYFQKSELDAALSAVILANKTNLNDADMVTKAIAEAKRIADVAVSPADVIVYRAVDASRVRLELSYKYPLRFNGIGVDMMLDCFASESLKPSGFNR